MRYVLFRFTLTGWLKIGSIVIECLDQGDETPLIAAANLQPLESKKNAFKCHILTIERLLT